jgi:hypothetical protein
MKVPTKSWLHGNLKILPATFPISDLGYFDLGTRVLEPLENPFGDHIFTLQLLSNGGRRAIRV